MTKGPSHVVTGALLLRGDQEVKSVITIRAIAGSDNSL